MTVLAMVSAKGAPGTTTTALALASVWSGPAVVADLDPVGGDVIWRTRTSSGNPLDPHHGLLSLGAGVRRGAAETALADHLQPTTYGDVLVGVRSPEQMAGLGGAWSQIPAVLSAHPGDVIADCGRVTQGSPTMPVLQRADVVCFVARPDLEGTAHLRERLESLRDVLNLGRPGGMPLAVILATSYRSSTVVQEMQQLLDSEGLGALVIGIVADDRKSAAAQAAGRGIGRTSLLNRSAVSLAKRLQALAANRADQGAMS